MMDEGQERVRATYRENYDRLARVKAQYDPDNVFRVNQNIQPCGRRIGSRRGRLPAISCAGSCRTRRGWRVLRPASS